MMDGSSFFSQERAVVMRVNMHSQDCYGIDDEDSSREATIVSYEEEDQRSFGAELLCEMKNSRRESSLLNENGSSPASFVQSLVMMLKYEDADYIDLVDGELLVCSPDALEASQILAKYYKHNNAKSFQRQLYNFGWVRASSSSSNKQQTDHDQFQTEAMAAFTHPAVACASKASGLDILLKLKRKSSAPPEPIQITHSYSRRSNNFRQQQQRYIYSDDSSGDFSPTSVIAFSTAQQPTREDDPYSSSWRWKQSNFHTSSSTKRRRRFVTHRPDFICGQF